jgi:hypothetical protein
MLNHGIASHWLWGEALSIASLIVHNRSMNRPWEEHGIWFVLGFTEEADRIYESSMGLSGDG